ncbi:MAG: carboxymuconolactone decarboxylase family protein [Candidatus Hodarchaeota archaeon]
MSKKTEDNSNKKNSIKPIRLSKPRIPPLDKSKWNEDVISQIKNLQQGPRGQVPNIFTTLANHPKLLKRWLVFGRHVTLKSSLPRRDREILMLRIGWLCYSEYEFGQHVKIGKSCGISDEEIKMIMEGPDAKGWDPFEAALLRAVDELHTDAFISDSIWNIIAERYNKHQLLDLIFTVGQYNLICMALNTLGVQLDGWINGFPE